MLLEPTQIQALLNKAPELVTFDDLLDAVLRYQQALDKQARTIVALKVDNDALYLVRDAALDLYYNRANRGAWRRFEQQCKLYNETGV